MKFSNLTRRLWELSAARAITQEDALSLVSVLWDDIRFESGTPVDRCAVRDWDQLLDELYALSYTVNTLYNTHKATVRELEHSDSEDPLWQQLREAEAACAEARGRTGQQQALSQQLQEQQERLRQELEQEQQARNNAQQCRQQVEALEQQLKELRSTALPPLTERYRTLEQELAEKQTLLEQMRQETEEKEAELQELSRQLQAHRETLTAQNTQRTDAQRQLAEAQAAREQLAAAAEQLTARLKQAEADNDAMARENYRVRTQLESQLADNDAFREEQLLRAQLQLNEAKDQAQKMNQALLDFTAEREAVGSEITNLKTVLASKNHDLDKKKEQLAQLNQELERLNSQLSAIAAGTQPLLDDISARKAQLDGMDREQIESGLRRDRESLQAQIEELEQKQRQRTELQDNLQRQASLVASEQEALDRLTAEKQALDDTYSALCRDVETMGQQLAALRSPEYAQRTEKLQRQQGILQQIRSNLEAGNRSLGCGWSFQLRQDLDQRLTASGQALKELQKAIQDYTLLWQNDLNQ